MGRGGRRRWPRPSAPNKPILLSVGYAACHWCHVMAHESFEDDATARVMNELFVNIKVDREERPDIDQIYMAALHHLGEHGGWPLTMFLTPDGEPIWGGTYFPNTSRYGKPAFVDVLREIARLFREEPQKIEHNRTALMARLAATARQAGTVTIGAAELDNAARQLGGIIDPVNGGTRGAPKFPQAALFELVVARRAAHRRGTLLRRRRDHARPHLRRRHLRSSRRRFFPLFGRRALARSAFRENALRQCAAPRAVGHRAPPRRQTALSPARPGNGRMAQARDDDRGGRVLGFARCRFGRRGGKVLRLVLRRGAERARHRGRRVFRPALRRDAGRQFRRPQHPQSAQAAAAQRSGRNAARRVARKTSRRARGARAPRPRRQGAGRLERTDDRGARQCEPHVRRADAWLATWRRALSTSSRAR